MSLDVPLCGCRLLCACVHVSVCCCLWFKHDTCLLCVCLCVHMHNPSLSGFVCFCLESLSGSITVIRCYCMCVSVSSCVCLQEGTVSLFRFIINDLGDLVPLFFSSHPAVKSSLFCWLLGLSHQCVAAAEERNKTVLFFHKAKNKIN